MTTLSDTAITLEIATGRLVKNSSSGQVNGACYELRLGNVYYDLTESEQPIPILPHQQALIKPGHRVVLITHEQLDIPSNFLARIVSKGSLFSVGLSPVSTYADPGFTGNIGIVTQNISNKYLLLPHLETIAKVDFTELSTDAAHLYRGQHGFQTSIWPIKNKLQKTHDDVKGDSRVGTEKEEGYRLLPQATAKIIQTLESRSVRTDVAILVAISLNALSVFCVGNNTLSHLQSLVGNLVASVICGIVATAPKWRT